MEKKLTIGESFIKEKLENCVISFNGSSRETGKIEFLNEKSVPLFGVETETKYGRFYIDIVLIHEYLSNILKINTSKNFRLTYTNEGKIIKDVITIFNKFYGEKFSFKLNTSKDFIRENYYGSDYEGQVLWKLPKKVRESINLKSNKEENENTINHIIGCLKK